MHFGRFVPRVLWTIPGALLLFPRLANADEAASEPAAVSTSSVEAAPGPSAVSAELDVSVADGQGAIHIDGRPVGEGSFRGSMSPGRHRIKVTREGYEPFESVVVLEPGEVRSESVSLRPSVGFVAFQSGSATEARDAHGLYGGVQLLGAMQPTGSGTTLEDACPTTGATTCSAGTVFAAGLLGYVGWLFHPIGFEAALLASADMVQPTASFDGEHGSEINPIVASPAREEKFTIGRFGGGAALRARVSYSTPSVRFSVAAGPGFSYRVLAFRRTTRADGGLEGETAQAGAHYFSPLLSLETSAHFRITKSFALAAGIHTWLEHAGKDTVSRAKQNTYLIGPDSRPLPQATPAYHLANGFQWYVGPFLGVAFGP